MYNELGGSFKTFQFVLSLFCQNFPPVGLHVPEIVPCSVVCNACTACNTPPLLLLPDANPAFRRLASLTFQRRRPQRTHPRLQNPSRPDSTRFHPRSRLIVFPCSRRSHPGNRTATSHNQPCLPCLPKNKSAPAGGPERTMSSPLAISAALAAVSLTTSHHSIAAAAGRDETTQSDNRQRGRRRDDLDRCVHVDTPRATGLRSTGLLVHGRSAVVIRQARR